MSINVYFLVAESVDVSPLNLEHASAELKFCTTLLVFQATQIFPSPSKQNKFNQPKALLPRTAKSLRVNCEFVILFYLFYYKAIHQKTLF